MAPESRALHTLPKLIVFDLDNTLWSPELYQLRKHQRTNQTPIAGKDVKLFQGAQAALDSIQTMMPDTKLAVASRTKSVEWAHDLLDQFNIRHLFDHVEIFPGNKRSHFENISRDSGIPFREMLFFDDARDGRYGNCEPVSQMGVLSVHCPGGLHSPDIFETALEKYKEWDGSPNTIVEWNGDVTNSNVNVGSTSTQVEQRQEGVVKMVNHDKGYGFIRYGNDSTRDLFFHFSSLDSSSVVEQGDKLSFVVGRDAKTGKSRAESVQTVLESSSSEKKKDAVKMHAFSMNMPFAALLANGYKTLETRNGTMFTPYPEGTRMLLHVGRRNYPDGDRHIDVMKSGGLDDTEIQELKSLPQGFGKGMAVAVVEIGKTYETTVGERSDPEFQRNVAAFGNDSGRMVTEIKRVEYLKKPVRVSGQGGVFKVDVDKDVLPDSFQPTNEVPYKAEGTKQPRKDDISSTTGKPPKGGTSPKGRPVYTISG